MKPTDDTPTPTPDAADDAPDALDPAAPPDAADAEDAELERIARISAWLDGELNAAERAAFEAEMAADPALRAEVDSFRSTVGALRELGPSMAPEAFVRQVETRIRTRSRGRFFADDMFSRARVPYEIFAALAVIILGALLFYSERKARDTDFAMAGKPSDGAEEPERPPGSAPAPASTPAAPSSVGSNPNSTPSVAPIRREVFVYSITLTAADPAARAAELAPQLRASSRDWQVIQRANGDAQLLTVVLPDAQVESLLSAYGKLGAVQKLRVYTDATTPVGQSRVTFHIAPPEKSEKPRKLR